MKPTIQFTAAQSREDAVGRRVRPSFRMPKTDFNYQAASSSDMRSCCVGPRRPSFRTISESYFKNEASQDFVGEAVFFGLIAITTALPLINSASALIHLVRSLGTL